MEFIVTILCTMSGALIGTAVGILLMYRKIRLPVTDTELNALRGSLRATETSLAAATVDLENLRKQVAERDRTIQKNSEELTEKQRQLGFAVAEAQRDAALLSAAEKKAQELSAEIAALTEQRAGLDASLEEEKRRIAEEGGRQAASFEAQLAGLEARFEEEKNRVAEHAARQVASVEEQVEEGKRQIHELDGEIAHFTTAYAELEAKLETELERNQQFTTQIAELQSERQSAAKGMELLLMAQQNLSRLLKPVAEDGANGSNGTVQVDVAGNLANELQPVS